VNDTFAADAERPALAAQTPAQVVWHDLECGAYCADLALWRMLARRADGAILDVGAGSGRVTLELARDGHAVTAVDCEQVLLDALRSRAAELPVETVCADARSLSLARRDYALCVMPMQTIQLLGSAAGRTAFLQAARTHLRPGGVVACAILGELEPFDCSRSDVGPTPEQAIVGDLLYVSRALRVAESRTHVVIERERRIARVLEPARPTDTHSSSETISCERDEIELDRVSAATIEAEARAVGLEPEPRLQISATEEHVGSVVVVLRA
jgi:2-polyprenyl-3-methyl-5-hydroxy-6-metoxy-1,4-benzoquinol methylase